MKWDTQQFDDGILRSRRKPLSSNPLNRKGIARNAKTQNPGDRRPAARHRGPRPNWLCAAGGETVVYALGLTTGWLRLSSLCRSCRRRDPVAAANTKIRC